MTGVKIDINDDGTVYILTVDQNEIKQFQLLMVL